MGRRNTQRDFRISDKRNEETPGAKEYSLLRLKKQKEISYQCQNSMEDTLIEIIDFHGQEDGHLNNQ